MALKRKIIINTDPFGNGKEVEYWVIEEKRENKRRNETTIQLVAYENREQSKIEMPIEYMRIDFVFTGLDFTRAQLYPMIKEDSRFTTAIDV